jgi:hypothetical protein
MELVRRYLQAVKWWLPSTEKQDIVNELSDDIHSQIDDREAELGHTLSDDEVEVILKRFGRPIAVAGRYLPQQNLIGPALYPMYRAVLRGLVFFYLIPWLIVWMCLLAFWPSYRVEHSGFAVLGDLTTLVNLGFYLFGVVTLVFAAIDRSQARLFDRWNPQHLPRLREWNRISRVDSVIEAAFLLVVFAWWMDPGTSWVQADGIEVTSIWRTLHARYFAAGGLILGVTLITSVLNAIRPYWTPIRVGIRAVCNAAASVILIAHLRENWPMVQTAREVLSKGSRVGRPFLAAALNISMYCTLLLAAVISIGCFVYEAIRFARLREAPAA